MKSCGLNGRTFQPTTKVNQNYKPTDCDTTAIFYTMCQQPLILKIMSAFGYYQKDEIVEAIKNFIEYKKEQ